jgi:hypothetical protein
MEKKIKAPSEKAIKKAEATRKAMYDMIVNTLSGRKRLIDLVDNVGVKTRVKYWNYVEKKDPKTHTYKAVVKVHDHGLIFNDGFEIRHIEVKVFGYLKGVPIEMRRERK